MCRSYNLGMPSLVYLSDAGTKANEKLTTVAGIVIARDDQWHHAVWHLNWVVNKHVPEKVRASGMLPRASELWTSKYDESWQKESRGAYLHDLLYVTENSSLLLAWGMARDPTTFFNAPIPLRPEQARHALAFQQCMAQADFGIGVNLPGHTTMMCVCEDNSNREFLQWLAEYNRQNPLVLPASPDLESRAFGVVTRGQAQVFSTRRMIDTVHFAARGSAPLVALADVCAWAIRRYMTGDRALANEFMKSLLSKVPLEQAFGNAKGRAGSGGSGLLAPANPFGPNVTPPPGLGFPSERK
jgi:hypothetical protein